MKKRLGEILLERGLIDVDQLNSALAHQRQWGMRLGTALVAKGFIAEGVLTRVLAESLNIPMVDLARVVVDPRGLVLIPRRTAEQYDVFPIAVKDQPRGRKILLLAMADPLNATAIDEIGFTTDCIVKPAIAQISSLESAIRRHYYGERVEIAPLAMQRRAPAGSPEEPMTIMTGHGERVVGRAKAEEPPMALTEPVTDPSASFPPPPMSSPSNGGGYNPLKPPAEYGGQPTGVFTMPPPSGEGAALLGTMVPKTAELEEMEALEKKFWALMRILARRGLVTKEEFLAELRAE